jgi:hypothetical protein
VVDQLHLLLACSEHFGCSLLFLHVRRHWTTTLAVASLHWLCIPIAAASALARSEADEGTVTSKTTHATTSHWLQSRPAAGLAFATASHESLYVGASAAARVGNASPGSRLLPIYPICGTSQEAGPLRPTKHMD